MKARILTNDPSLIVMFRLGSIEGSLVYDKLDAKNKFEEAIKEEDLAVLIITKTISGWIEAELKAHRENESIPLTVIIDG